MGQASAETAAFCRRADIARKGLRVRHQEMRKQNRLGMLHVGHARHGNLQIGFCLLGEGADEGEQRGANFR